MMILLEFEICSNLMPLIKSRFVWRVLFYFYAFALLTI